MRPVTELVVPHVRLRSITKRFGPTLALDRVDLDIVSGSVHGLVGENGAGKSTLGKVLAGVVMPTSGSIAVCGEPVVFRSPRQALASGIAMISQELSLVPGRTVLDNVYLGVEHTVGPFVSRASMRRSYGALAERTGIIVDPDAFVHSLSVAEQQLVEILRALVRDARLIVFDEPTARLSSNASANLLGVVKDLATSGTTVLLVSHFLQPVLDVCDTVTVLRDGALVRTSPTTGDTVATLLQSMIARTLTQSFPTKTRPPADAPRRLEVCALSQGSTLDNVSLHVRTGEIVAVAGLVGAGRSTLLRSIFGAVTPSAGRVLIDGQDLKLGRPNASIDAGMAFIPESRRDDGLIMMRSVRENTALPHLDRFSVAGVLDQREERMSVRGSIDRTGVRAASVETSVDLLSGGNQQKVMFSRWLAENPRMLIADEPTRGVDPGAKNTIHNIIVELALHGSAVLFVSSDLEEVIGLAHRVLVMREGRLVAEFDGFDTSDLEVARAAFGSDQCRPSPKL